MDDGKCPECPCCWDENCDSTYTSGCPTNGLGESVCPCTATEVI
ncbi:hypothetical protein [Streptosporangium sp. NPDC002721]